MGMDRAARARAERARRRAEEERRLQEQYAHWCRIIMGGGSVAREGESDEQQREDD